MTRYSLFLFLFFGCAYADDAYRQITILGANNALCANIQEILKQNNFNRVDINSECDPNLGFIRITCGGKNVDAIVDLLKIKIEAVVGKPVDNDVYTSKGARLTTGDDIYRDLFATYGQSPSDEELEKLKVFCASNLTEKEFQDLCAGVFGGGKVESGEVDAITP